MSKIPTDPNPRDIGRLAAFRFREFRLFWISLFISNTGTWMQMTAINWLLYELTHSPIQLGMNGIFRAVPAITFGLFSGALADRYDRKRILLCTQLTAGLLALGLAVLDHSGFIQVWHIYAFTFISSTVNSLDGPAGQALFPSLIPRSVLPNAVALNSVLWKGAALFGLSHSFLLSLALLMFVGATDTVWGATRNTILQLKAPEGLRGRIMGVFNISSRGFHPLGQVETGLVVPLIGAREATFMGGLLVTTMVFLTAWKIPGIPKFRWDERLTGSSEADASDEERPAG